jgi:crotonobetainyl-CoA:carnitine CoA-transferase CaiB-like acyl-CoA transferase
MTGPLEGVRVLDVTLNMSGPLATMILADQGADVIKVESRQGDIIRGVGTRRGDTSAYFANCNRNKRSIVVDLQTPEGIELLLGLAETADVFVQNFRFGVAERLGIGARAVRARNPGLVYVSISGFGPTGPMHELPAYDHVVQALSGIGARQTDGAGAPGLVRHGLVEKATAYTAAQAITAALLARHRTGEGDDIEVSLLDSALAFFWPDGMMAHTCLDPELAGGRDVAGSFRLTRTADGYVSVVTMTDAQWSGLLRAVGLGADERTATLEARQRHGGEIMREVARLMGELPTDEVVARLGEEGVPCAALVPLDEVAAVPQVVANRSLVEYDHPTLGRIRQPRPAARFTAGPAESTGLEPSPGLGQHTAAVLSEAGYGDAEVADLVTRGVIGGS